MNKLQALQNKAARIVLGLPSHATVTDNMLFDLHWLKVEQRLVFKQLLTVHKFFIDCSPAYFSNQLIVSTRGYRLLELWYFDTRPGRRSFSFTAPRFWNKLSQDIRLLNNTDKFKRSIKTALMLNANNIMSAAQGYRL